MTPAFDLCHLVKGGTCQKRQRSLRLFSRTKDPRLLHLPIRGVFRLALLLYVLFLGCGCRCPPHGPPLTYRCRSCILLPDPTNLSVPSMLGNAAPMEVEGGEAAAAGLAGAAVAAATAAAAVATAGVVAAGAAGTTAEGATRGAGGVAGAGPLAADPGTHTFDQRGLQLKECGVSAVCVFRQFCGSVYGALAKPQGLRVTGVLCISKSGAPPDSFPRLPPRRCSSAEIALFTQTYRSPRSSPSEQNRSRSPPPRRRRSRSASRSRSPRSPASDRKGRKQRRSPSRSASPAAAAAAAPSRGSGGRRSRSRSRSGGRGGNGGGGGGGRDERSGSRDRKDDRNGSRVGSALVCCCRHDGVYQANSVLVSLVWWGGQEVSCVTWRVSGGWCACGVRTWMGCTLSGSSPGGDDLFVNDSLHVEQGLRDVALSRKKPARARVLLLQASRPPRTPDNATTDAPQHSVLHLQTAS